MLLQLLVEISMPVSNYNYYFVISSIFTAGNVSAQTHVMCQLMSLVLSITAVMDSRLQLHKLMEAITTVTLSLTVNGKYAQKDVPLVCI